MELLRHEFGVFFDPIFMARIDFEEISEIVERFNL